MYCRNCGQQINDKAVICPYCGCATGNKSFNPVNPEDSGSIGWGILGFFFPLIGLIIYLIWREERPRSARVAGKGALISVVLSVCLSVLSMVLIISCATCASLYI